MKKTFTLFTMLSLAAVSNAQILKNTELTFSPFGTNTLRMNSSLDWQYGFRTDISKFGGIMINGVNAWVDDNARNHPYYFTYPNVTPARSNTEGIGDLKKSKKKFFELGYYYPVATWGASSRLLGRAGFYKTRNAFAIVDADEPNDGTGAIQNPFYGINTDGSGDSIQFGPYGREKDGYYSTGYGIMRSSGGYVGVSLNHFLDENSTSDFAVTYDLYADFIFGSVKFDDMYLIGTGFYSPTGQDPIHYKLYNNDVHKTGYRLGFNVKIPAQKMIGFYFNLETGKRPGYNGLDKNQRAYFQFLMGASMSLSKDNLSKLNPF
jgi:hypothetical protein